LILWCFKAIQYCSITEPGAAEVESRKELVLHVRNITAKLKQGSIDDLKRRVENEILPVLRKQNGFRDEVLCIAPERLEARAISFWDSKEAADTFERTTYPNLLKTMSDVIEGTPKMETFELLVSTLHKLTAKA
jgi:hypothetical protein